MSHATHPDATPSRAASNINTTVNNSHTHNPNHSDGDGHNDNSNGDDKNLTAKSQPIDANPSHNKTYLKNLLQPYKRQMMTAFFIAVLSMGIFILQSYLLATLFADWLTAVSHKSPVTTELAWQLLPWLALCLIIRPVLGLVKDQYLLKTSLAIRADVRKKLLHAIVTLGPARQHFGSDGSLSTKVLEQVDELDGYISRFYVQRYVAVLTPILIIIATFFYSPLAAILMLLTAPLVPVFMILVGSAAAAKSQQQFVAMSQLSGRFLDLLRGMPTLKRLNATTQALATVRESSTDYQKRTMSVLRLAFLSGAVLELFASLAIALVALYLGLGLLGVLPWAKGDIPVPYQGALFILLLAPEFYAPLRQLGSDYHAKAKAEAAVAAFYPMLQAVQSTKSTHTNTHDATDTNASASSLKAAPALTLDNLSIRSDDGRVRLACVNAHIGSQQCVAIVGESGSGKSSLLQALLGFVPFTGNICIDDREHTQPQLARIRHHIGYLAQSTSLLPLSIADNLRLAKADASDDELIQVLTQVELWSLLSQLPDGLDTLLGERGSGLSGGQQQRLAIAQLLLRDATLWLIDEPCAHLDPETAAQIYHLLGQLSTDKTVLLVSHDLSQVDWVAHDITLAMPTDDIGINNSNNHIDNHIDNQGKLIPTEAGHE